MTVNPDSYHVWQIWTLPSWDCPFSLSMVPCKCYLSLKPLFTVVVIVRIAVEFLVVWTVGLCSWLDLGTGAKLGHGWARREKQRNQPATSNSEDGHLTVCVICLNTGSSHLHQVSFPGLGLFRTCFALWPNSPMVESPQNIPWRIIKKDNNG